MLGDRAAGAGAEAADDVDDAVREPRFGYQLAEAQRSERGLFGGLENDGVAAGERRTELPRGHQEREVPRDNLAADADRLAQGVVEEGRIGRVGLVIQLSDP